MQVWQQRLLLWSQVVFQVEAGCSWWHRQWPLLLPLPRVLLPAPAASAASDATWLAAGVRQAFEVSASCRGCRRPSCRRTWSGAGMLLGGADSARTAAATAE